MLQQFREKILGGFATVLLGFIILTFSVWGIQGYFQYTQGEWVAMVDGEAISVGAFRNEYQQQLARLQQMFGAQYRPELFDNQTTKERVVDQLVREALVAKRTKDGGYRISDAQLAAEIQKFEYFQVDGQFSREVMAQRLTSINMSPAAFDARLRRDMLGAQLPDAVMKSEFLTPVELARSVALRDEQRAATWIGVPTARFLPQVQLSDADLTAWYEVNKSRYMTEETVAIEYLELTPDAIKDQLVAPTDDQLRELYAAEQEKFARPEQRSARHILLDATDLVRAEALAKQLMARIAKGEDFAKLATELSQDPGSASQGGSLGWIERGVMVGPFDDALFSMKPGEVRGPVKTEFGIHVIRLDDVRAAQARPYEDVKAELAAKWSADKVVERFGQATEQLAELTYSNSETLKAAADALGLTIGKVEGVTRSGGAGLAADEKVRGAAFSADVLGERRNSNPIELEAEHVVVVRIADHQPPLLRPFAEVKEQVTDAARSERASALASAYAEGMAQRLRDGEVPVTLAKYEKLSPPTSRTIMRDDQNIPAEITKALFRAGVPSTDATAKRIAGVAQLPSGDHLVFRLDAVIPGDVSALVAADRAKRRDDLERRGGNIALTVYTRALELVSSVKYQKDKAQ